MLIINVLKDTNRAHSIYSTNKLLITNKNMWSDINLRVKKEDKANICLTHAENLWIQHLTVAIKKAWAAEYCSDIQGQGLQKPSGNLASWWGCMHP